MIRICVFAGTGDGRKLTEYLACRNVQVTACAATEYGGELVKPAERLTVLTGRLSKDDMLMLFKREEFDLVIDATHPYAEAVTESVSEAASECGIRYIRMLREDSCTDDSVVWAADTQEAVRILDSTDGTILLTTGSKDLGTYSVIRDFSERVYVRVLPMEDSLLSCRKAGVRPSHIIAMQGPFTLEMNTALLKQTGAQWMVTKDGGQAGGFDAKAAAAAAAGVKLLVVGRPRQHEGYNYSRIISLLEKEYGLVRKCNVVISGIGPGSKDLRTMESIRAFSEAECIIGAARMTDAVRNGRQQVFNAVAPVEISAYIHEHKEFTDFAVAMSGDSGFFSGTKKLTELLSDCNVTILPGLSSLSVLCARLGVSYEDIKTVSLHGRNRNIVRDVISNKKVFTLVGGNEGVKRVLDSLCSAGYGAVHVTVGERLSYPEERIISGTADELRGDVYDSLSAVLIENPFGLNVTTHGLPDTAFIRGGGRYDDLSASDGKEAGKIIPMTKQAVRSVSLSMLGLTRDAICWDVGAGTGSVSVEMALQCDEGHVYAIEKRPDAIELIYKNAERFFIDNITVIHGAAPEECEELPAPTHVFIGGSSGNMKEIIMTVLQKNPEAKIAASAVTLESVAELTGCINTLGLFSSEVISLNTAVNKKAGSYNLMTARNPVYIFLLKQ
ncbi:MAG: precorrin-6A reductase [Parasporobacterium sp.]|nr:precorrin-6A reductase [Parasporobacterium sp.]